MPIKSQFKQKIKIKIQLSSQDQENVRFDVTYPNQMLELSIINAKGKMTKISFVDQVLIELTEGQTTSKFYSTTKIHHFALKMTFSITFPKFGHGWPGSNKCWPGFDHSVLINLDSHYE